MLETIQNKELRLAAHYKWLLPSKVPQPIHTPACLPAFFNCLSCFSHMHHHHASSHQISCIIIMMLASGSDLVLPLCVSAWLPTCPITQGRRKSRAASRLDHYSLPELNQGQASV
jgi:hypothetical protein